MLPDFTGYPEDLCCATCGSGQDSGSGSASNDPGPSPPSEDGGPGPGPPDTQQQPDPPDTSNPNPCEDTPYDAWDASLQTLATQFDIKDCAAAVPMMSGVGILCDTDISTNALVQAVAPGMTGRLKILCPETCDWKECDEFGGGATSPPTPLFVAASIVLTLDAGVSAETLNEAAAIEGFTLVLADLFEVSSQYVTNVRVVSVGHRRVRALGHAGVRVLFDIDMAHSAIIFTSATAAEAAAAAAERLTTATQNQSSGGLLAKMQAANIKVSAVVSTEAVPPAGASQAGAEDAGPTSDEPKATAAPTSTAEDDSGSPVGAIVGGLAAVLVAGLVWWKRDALKALCGSGDGGAATTDASSAAGGGATIEMKSNPMTANAGAVAGAAAADTRSEEDSKDAATPVAPWLPPVPEPGNQLALG